jgi:hypothetical protein
MAPNPRPWQCVCGYELDRTSDYRVCPPCNVSLMRCTCPPKADHAWSPADRKGAHRAVGRDRSPPPVATMR